MNIILSSGSAVNVVSRNNNGSLQKHIQSIYQRMKFSKETTIKVGNKEGPKSKPGWLSSQRLESKGQKANSRQNITRYLTTRWSQATEHVFQTQRLGLQYLRISTKSSWKSVFPNTPTLSRELASKWIWPYFIFKHIANKQIGLEHTRSRHNSGTHYSGLLKETYSSTRRVTLFGSWEQNPTYHIYRLQQNLPALAYNRQLW